MRKTIRPTLAGLLCLAALASPPALARERKDIPEKLTWDLLQIYPSEQAWAAARDRLSARLAEMAKFQGHLADSAQSLEAAFTTQLELRKELDRVYAYAMFLNDQDTRDSQHQAMLQTAQQLSVKFDAATAYVRPELLAAGQPKISGFLASSEKLKPYQQVFANIFRLGTHTLGPSEEKLAAEAGDLKDSGSAVHGVFCNAELPYPTIPIQGKPVRLDAAGYTQHRADPDRKIRKAVFHAFWSRYQDYRRTLATTLYCQIKGHVFEKKIRHYDSCLEAALFPENIPTGVYKQLLADVHKNLPTLHRYLKLRKKLMGLKDLGYEDLYAPLTRGSETEYTPEQAMQLTLEAVSPLGPAYQKAMQEAYAHRWVDFLPSTGKRSGAYSEGAVYDLHPYQLLNFNGHYEDVSTLAHESGHSLHSYLSNTHQPYGLHSYSIFVAEVASTCNENLLFHYMLDHSKDDKMRLALLGQYLEGMRTTLFRQTLLAEFELAVHEMVEKGEPLTGDACNKLYLKLLRQYYGHDQGICKVDELYGVEWAYIPHFYYNFYVYQYATSMVASNSIANAILAEDKGASHPAREAYLKMLSSGSSLYPIDLLKGANVDMTTSAPFEAAMKEMNKVMDAIEAIPATHK